MIPQSEDAARRWQRVTDHLAAIVREFPDAALDAPSACGGWTNRELLAHIATGYAVRIARLRAISAGEPPPCAPTDPQNDARAAALAGAPRRRISEELIAQRGVVAELIARLRPEHLRALVTLDGTLVGVRDMLLHMSAHDLAHAAELRPAPPAFVS